MFADLPTGAAMIVGITAYVSDFFTALLPLIYVSIGVMAAALGVLYIKRIATGGISRVVGGARRGRARRRR